MSYSRRKKYRALQNLEDTSSSDENNNDDDNIQNSLLLSTTETSQTAEPKSSIRRNDSLNSDVNISGGVGSHFRESSSDRSNRSFISVDLSDTSTDPEADSDDQLLQSSGVSEEAECPELMNSLEDRRNLQEKLRDCAVKHLNHVTHSFFNDLLHILRSEGHTDLPETAKTLLRTQRTNNLIQPMLSKKGSYGTYMYLGIKNHLQLQISNSGLKDKEIRVLVNVDGLLIYVHSKLQMWPILMQILHKDYNCEPFVVSLYCGNSKPQSADNLLNDFIKECTVLIEEGMIIDDQAFGFTIAAFVCDTPARAFIKCCKGHTAFYSCERCTVHGKTVNRRRVFKEMNCHLRTKASFVEKRQTEHHLPEIISPLIRIPGFDPIKQVVLDYMHLLCCGVEKSLFEKWLSTKKQKGKLEIRERSTLSELLISLTPPIPMEFQRKVFDVTDITNWKATQYRFLLLYVSGIILRKVLSRKMYSHYLLLFVACRILCSRTRALKYNDKAESCLRDFFKQMAPLYGKESQVMNFHNLIHLADDVRYMKASLTEYSSFPFENCLGHIKKLIRTPRNPVAQVFRRLSEEDSTSQIIRKFNAKIDNHKYRKTRDETHRPCNIFEYAKIRVESMTIGIAKSDNIVKLKNNDIFEVSRIFSPINDPNRMLIEGKTIKQKGESRNRKLSKNRYLLR